VQATTGDTLPGKKQVCGSGLIIIFIWKKPAREKPGDIKIAAGKIQGAPAAVASSWPPECRTWSRCPGKSAPVMLMMRWDGLYHSYVLYLHVQKYPSAFCICMNAHVNK